MTRALTITGLAALTLTVLTVAASCVLVGGVDWRGGR